jgi:2-phospho-L-lactate guanylyltransferase
VSPPTDIWAIVPIKELEGAKQRLAPLLSPAQRRALIEVMMGEVLEAIAGAKSLAGLMVVTLDPQAAALANRLGARVVTDGARDGHTGSVTAGLKLLAREGRGGMITLPADIPAATSAEIDRVVVAHLAAPSFTISPAHDDLGSNAVICSPPDAVPLRFGENSYFPHLEAARRCGIEPTVIRQPGIAMDIDHPVDLAAFLRLPQSTGTRTRALVEEMGIPKLLTDRGPPAPACAGRRPAVRRLSRHPLARRREDDRREFLGNERGGAAILRHGSIERIALLRLAADRADQGFH